jgi:hypothetical protein
MRAAAWALTLRSFALYCVATAVIGVYNAFGLQYRFAAAEVAAPAVQGQAISLVLAGGLVGGVVGPESARHGPISSPRHLSADSSCSSLSHSRSCRAVARACAEAHARRALGQGACRRSCANRCSSSQCCREVSATASNLLMTATPIAMHFCSHPFGAVATVIRMARDWHVCAGFFTGSLIKRHGVLRSSWRVFC